MTVSGYVRACAVSVVAFACATPAFAQAKVDIFGIELGMGYDAALAAAKAAKLETAQQKIYPREQTLNGYKQTTFKSMFMLDVQATEKLTVKFTGNAVGNKVYLIARDSSYGNSYYVPDRPKQAPGVKPLSESLAAKFGPASGQEVLGGYVRLYWFWDASGKKLANVRADNPCVRAIYDIRLVGETDHAWVTRNPAFAGTAQAGCARGYLAEIHPASDNPAVVYRLKTEAYDFAAAEESGAKTRALLNQLDQAKTQSQTNQANQNKPRL